MIKLNLAIYDGNIQVIDFNSKYELTEFILAIKQSFFDCVGWQQMIVQMVN